mmetsp:Transcript_61359/g.182800  ORF Transcript_61359/g.182800 Transcript_61359/m.182800 type:complete len:382 (-) Transcript_61359:255-1400(-)|eukprot:CAMPEP_0175384888 /NCGR_PEP_ID=MMETSP0095-20121207/28568_1 /TAXON_ID=311494 /ORGANISM="Alexandrium monilatum, Strain CCMP3105" /LENGTH=381 /DNA_ID=CAMNT_0016683307 /DNA_START=90 /DNA_END=1235 /DNA_ORIENTATION=+
MPRTLAWWSWWGQRPAWVPSLAADADTCTARHAHVSDLMGVVLGRIVGILSPSAVKVSLLILLAVPNDALDDGGVAQVRPLGRDLGVHAQPLRDGIGVGNLPAEALGAHVPRRPGDQVDVPCSNEVLGDSPRRTDDDLVNPLASAHIQDPLVEAHHRHVRAFRSAHHKVLVYPDEQEGPEGPGVLQELRMANVEHVEGAPHVDDPVLVCRLARRRELRDAPRACQQLHRSTCSQAARVLIVCRSRRTSLGQALRCHPEAVLEPLQVDGAHPVPRGQLAREGVGFLEGPRPAADPRAVLDGVIGAQAQARRGRRQPRPGVLGAVLVPTEGQEPPDDVRRRHAFGPLDDAQAACTLHLVVGADPLGVHRHVVAVDAEVRSRTL